jgi:hypothetical protein
MVILTQKQASHQLDQPDLKIKQAKHHQPEQMGRQEQNRQIQLAQQGPQQLYLRNRVDMKMLLDHKQHKTTSLLHVRLLEANPQRPFHQNSSNLP